MKCEVCGENEVERVACSATGAFSFGYCAGCLRSGREPYGAVVASLVGLSSFEEVALWYKPIVLTTLEAEGRSVDDLFRDVVTFTKTLGELGL